MFFPVGQQTYPTLVHVPWVEYTTVSGVVRKQVWSKSISWRWRLSILPAFLQQMTCLYSLTRIIFPSILRRDGNSTGSKPHTLQLYAWLTAAFMNQFYDTYFCQPAKTNSRCVSRLQTGFDDVWWVSSIHPVILIWNSKLLLKNNGLPRVVYHPITNQDRKSTPSPSCLGFLEFSEQPTLVGNTAPVSSFGWTKVVTILDDHLSSPYDLSTYQNHRRKFRSETSDNMDSWKAEVRRVRREKIRRKKR